MPEPRPSAYAALAHPNYQRFIAGFIFAGTGLQMLAAAASWEIYERTGSAWHLGVAGLCRALPVLVLALPAGHAADLYSRRNIVVASQVGFALCAAGLAAVSRAEAPIWMLYALLLATGCCRAFNGPARGSLLPTIVPGATFQNAVTWTSAAFQYAAIVGPIVAGVMIARSGAIWPVYAVTAVGNLIFAALALGIRPLVATPGNGTFTARSMLAGMGHLWRERTILGAITLDLFAVLLGGATALMPIFAKDVLKVDEVGFGALRAAPYVGALVMAFAIAHRPPFRHAGTTLLWAVVAFGVAMIVFGLSRSLWLSLAALFASGAVDNISVVVRHVLVQVRTPDQLRGRVGAVNSVFIECSNELGAFESGAVAALVTPVFSVVSGGVGTIVVAVVVALAFPELRRLGELRDREQEQEEDRRP